MGERADRLSADWKQGFNYAMSVIAFWLDFHKSMPQGSFIAGLTGIGMHKSNLLGRLMKGQEVRRRPCPIHEGKQHVLADCECNGTGWLSNE